MKWIDTTRRAKGEAKDSEVREWTLELPHPCRLVLFHYMGSTTQWSMSCYPLGLERVLQTGDADEAKWLALELVRERLNEWLQALGRAT